MSRTVYLNGAYVREHEAKVSVFDRAFLFADGIYEVTAVVEGRLVDFAPHYARLVRSLGEIAMTCPLPEAELKAMHETLIERNGLKVGVIYLEITRGPADRDFVYPENVRQTVVAFTQEKQLVDNPAATAGVAVVTFPDLRWKRRDIKTTGLLASAMAKQAAKDKGAGEALLVEDGFVTEGASSSIFIVTRENEVVTRPLSQAILPGVTRRAILLLSKAAAVRIVERPFTVEEAIGAREAFLTSASSFVVPIVSIDGRPVGDGKPGPVTAKLRTIYLDQARKG